MRRCANLSLPLRDGWNIVAMERLLIAIDEQDERYASERRRSALRGRREDWVPDCWMPGCASSRSPIIRTLSPTPAPDRGSCEGDNDAQPSPSADASAVAALL